jgi:hypothetical protein
VSYRLLDDLLHLFAENTVPFYELNIHTGIKKNTIAGKSLLLYVPGL